jgi:predicted ribosome quality control (RQC) complex YloA/Tae2 family protein
MDNFYLSAIVAETLPLLLNRNLARISLVNSDLLFDFRLPGERLLRASFDQTQPAYYLDKACKEPQNDAHPFLTTLRKEIIGARLTGIYKPALDRYVCLEFERLAESGHNPKQTLAFSFTGRTANAYLLDADNRVEVSLNTRGSNVLRVGDDFDIEKSDVDAAHVVKRLIEAALLAEEITDSTSLETVLEDFFKRDNLFSPLLEKEFTERCRTAKPADALRSLLDDLSTENPLPLLYSRFPLEEIGDRQLNLKTDLLLSYFPLAIAKDLKEFRFKSLSEASSLYYQIRKQSLRLQNRFNEVNRFLNEAIKKRAKRLEAIRCDKAKFENPERFKQLGDLLLANFATARRQGAKAFVIDYYDPLQAEIEIEIGEEKSLQQASSDFFSRYQKARRALEAIAALEASLQPTLDQLCQLANRLQEDVSPDQLEKIKTKAETLLGLKPKALASQSTAKKATIKKPTGRRFLTAAGFEIIVGKTDKENDAITFRLAGSLDIWMHAADYPGSHVIIRNPNRLEIPPKVIQEAAELAAFYSSAKEQNKVAVHYTQKKFVTKPPRAKPGLVRLSSFKTILVEPRRALKKIEP